MSETNLEKVKEMIKELSTEERRQILPYLAEFPDTNIHSYDLREELETLKKYGVSAKSFNLDPENYLVDLLFIRNLVSVQIRETEIMRAMFFPDNFIEAFPKLKGFTAKWSDGFKQRFFTKERRDEFRTERAKNGIQESDGEFEAVITETCNNIAEFWMNEQAMRIAEQISLHLPGMVGDMICAAIVGQNIYDMNKASEELGLPNGKWSTEKTKKLVLDSHWRQVKPHLGITQGGNRRTLADWQGEEVLIKYSQRTNELRLLAESIKDVFDDCIGEAGWIEDLRKNSNFQKLSQGVSDEIIDWAIRRVASDETISKREREPLSIACEMARKELNLPEQDIETLRSYHIKGRSLTKQNRAKNN